MKTLAQRIYELGIVPVVKIDNANDAVPLAKALMAGGLKCVEITFRTDAAEEAIRNITQEVPGMLVGAGTVLTCDQVDRAVSAGAQFIVSPGFNESTAQYCIDKKIPIIPGCNDPSSIEKALALGLTDLKFFPAEESGGIKMIKSLCAPYTAVRFMPTGGINIDNLNDYLSYDKVLACGGTWMVKDTLIKEGRFEEIEKLTREAVVKMIGFKLRHIGINCQNEEEAINEAKKLCLLFGMQMKIGNSSVFAGQEFELMKKPFLGKNGHICIAVNSVDRAYAFLQAQGYEFKEETLKRDEKGRIQVVYLEEEISGFAIHFING